MLLNLFLYYMYLIIILLYYHKCFFLYILLDKYRGTLIVMLKCEDNINKNMFTCEEMKY